MLTVEDVVDELMKLIYHIAHNKSSDATIMMSFDEIVGELSYELVKTFRYYQDKDLSDAELLAVIKRSMDNRVSELVYKYFKTHRHLGNDPVDITALDNNPNMGNSSLLTSVNGVEIKASVHADATLIESRERVAALYTMLSPTAQVIVDQILSGNELISLNMQLSVQRAANVYKSQTTKVRLMPWHIADSLGLDIEQVEEAFMEIKQKYAEVCEYA